MNHRFPSSLFFPLSIIFVLQVMLQIPLSLGNNGLYEDCLHAQFKCGNITARYPFSGEGIPYFCGHPDLKLDCDNNITTTIEIARVNYQVLEIPIQRDGQTPRMRIARQEYIKHNDICKPESRESTFDYGPFELVDARGYANVTLLYDCPKFTQPFPEHFNCSGKGDNYYKDIVFWVVSEVPGSVQCSANVTVPILQSFLVQGMLNQSNLLQGLKKGFDVKWKQQEQVQQVCETCKETGGSCGFDAELRTTCYCPNATNWQQKTEVCSRLTPAIAPTSTGNYDNNRRPVSLGIGLAIAGAAIVGIALGIGFLRFRQRRKKIADQIKSRDLPTTPSSKGPSTSTTSLSQSIPSYPTAQYDLEKGSTYFGAHVFSYEELEQATENFNPSKELGEGGFGTVYYGVLNDGRVVAVKRLYESNFKRVDQYMNEIEILTRIRHPNLVTLYGCTSRRSRELLLVYEYIPNGTVADHLHGRLSNSSMLTWPVRLGIAVEAATALAYLHATEIIHRDVKSNNILLDNFFHVKVADFGLSRLFPNDVTHVSTAPQGTPGYVDPEYYQCYQLTEKSDVYSFGVVLVELISAKQAVDTNRHRHDINLANMAVSRIQNHSLHELVDPSLGFENDHTVKRMMTAVAELAFRCLQQDRNIRPSMEEVLETLIEIQNEELGVQKADAKYIRSKAEVMDIRSDDVGLLKHISPPLSPDSETDKWMQIRSM